MKLQGVKLRGFLGLKKGLGLDEIELDLSGLSGLVALSGPNGFGKSTFMENLQPFPVLASRGGALKHHCFLRDSSRDLSFNFQGDDYRTLIKIDSDSDRSEGFVWRNGRSQVDGKISNYKQYINELFGSPSLFFSSVFAAQNAEKISDMTTGELKKLFSEFLRLDRLIQFENTSKQVGNIITGNVEKLTRVILQMEHEIQKRDAVEKELDRFLAERGTINTQIALNGDFRDAHIMRIAELKEQKIKAEADRRRLDDLKKTLTAIDGEIKSEKDHGEEQLSKHRANLILIKTELINIGNLLENETEIRKAVETVETLEPILSDSKKDIEELKGIIKADEDQLFSSRANLQTVFGEIKLLNSSTDTARLEQKIKGLIDQTGSLDLKDKNVTCPECDSKFECPSDSCSFIVSALDAVKQLPELERKLTEIVKIAAQDTIKLRDREKRIDADVSTLSEAVGVKGSALGLKITRIEMLQAKHDKAADLAKQISKVEVAASQKTYLEKQKIDITARGTDIKTRMEQMVKEKETRQTEIETEIQILKYSIDDEIDDKIDKEDRKKWLAEKAIGVLENDLLKIAGEIAAAQQKLVEFKKIEAELKETQDSMDRLKSELSDWRYIQQSCPALRILEIDGAAPIITGYANGILSKTFGPNAMVRLDTQNDKGKDDLSIIVIDEDGDEVELSDRSGGQQIWALKALRLGMTLLSKEKSGKDFRTGMADEEDGGLDTESSKNFIRLYREFMNVGKLDTFFYITHNENCRDMADHVMEFSKGGVAIQ